MSILGCKTLNSRIRHLIPHRMQICLSRNLIWTATCPLGASAQKWTQHRDRFLLQYNALKFLLVKRKKTVSIIHATARLCKQRRGHQAATACSKEPKYEGEAKGQEETAWSFTRRLCFGHPSTPGASPCLLSKHKALLQKKQATIPAERRRPLSGAEWRVQLVSVLCRLGSAHLNSANFSTGSL